MASTAPEAAPAKSAAERIAEEGLESYMQGRLARFETRRYDWDALKFQADFDPKYRRAQIRYVGTGATGAKDENIIPAEHFTFSTMCLPSGCEGPLHVHHDVEEVFFMLRGKVKLIFRYGEEECETILNERDVVSIPPGIYRGLVNIGQEEALMCVMLGTGQPSLPTYPSDHPLSKIKRS